MTAVPLPTESSTGDGQAVRFMEDHYVPILKGRLGEFEALSRTDDATRSQMTPLLEVVPGNLDDEDPDLIELSIRRFAERLAQKWPFGDRVMTDVGLLAYQTPLSGGRLPVVMLAEELASRGVQAIPVVRLGESSVVQEAAATVIAERAGGACIRVTVEDFDADVPLDQLLTTALRELRITPDQVDLVIDYGTIRDDSVVTLSSNLSRYVLRTIPDLEAWRSFTIAAGAFPAELSSFTPGLIGEVPRLDAQLWRAIVDRSSLARTPGFGDYAIAHPVLPQGAGFAPAPQLRYTSTRDWLILKGRKNVRRGSQQFYDLCKVLIDEDLWFENLSWGDEYIYAAAQAAEEGAVPTVGTGNASTWRAVGTSHHLGLVTHLLATHGEP
jgi:hypothetical protein